MRPASIVALVLSVLMIIGGFITCSIAKKMADENNESLFGEAFSTDGSHPVDLEGKDFEKIELILEDAEINIYGNEDRNLIEFINFSSNYYALSTNSKTISFNENPSLYSAINIWENGFNFKGMRYFINKDTLKQVKSTGKKIVNIYLKEDAPLNAVEITGEKISLNIRNISLKCDYTILASDITITTAGVSSTSFITARGPGDSKPPAGQIKFTSSSDTVGALRLSSDSLSLQASSLTITGKTSISCKTGSVNLSLTSAPSMEINSLGLVTVNGESSESFSYASETAGDSMLTIEGGNANITVYYSIQEEDPGTE